MHSVRISDHLYVLAKERSGLAHRSLNQQVEHWAAIGQAAEAAGLSADDLIALALKHQQERDAQDVRAGRLHARSLHFIPVEMVGGVTYPDDSVLQPPEPERGHEEERASDRADAQEHRAAGARRRRP